VRSEGIDAVVTTSSPHSIHFVGAAVKRATGAKWVADMRDSMVDMPDWRTEKLAVRAKLRVNEEVAKLVARQADAIVTVTDTIADEMRAYDPNGEVEVIPNGADFEDFAGLEYRRADRFRVTHTGSFLGGRTPRPFLEALAQSGLEDVVARFVGDFRAADREWAEKLDLGDRLELVPFVPRREALALQRDTEALLLLIPDSGGRGASVPSGKIFDYLAAERPILASVPVDGAAASLIRELDAGVVAPPDDPAAIAEALRELHARWRAGELDGVTLTDHARDRISRATRAGEYADLLRSLA
jgi:glycosyltransferase involved in cell wall biosynthesis